MQVAVLHVQMPVPQHRLVGEAHHAVDLLPAQRVAEHTHRALFDERRPIVHIRQRLHAHLTRQRAAGTGMVAAQHARDVVGRLEHDARVAARLCERERIDVLPQPELFLEQAERARARPTERIDRLIGVADGAHRRTVGRRSVEQFGEQRRLRGGRVLVFVEQHMRVAAAVACADRGEARDELERGDREVAELRHVAFALGLLEQRNEREQRVASARDRPQLRGAPQRQGGRIVAQTRLVACHIGFVELGGAFFAALRGPLGALRLLGRHLEALEHRVGARDEPAVPCADARDRRVDVLAPLADHRVGDAAGQLQHLVHEAREPAEILA